MIVKISSEKIKEFIKEQHAIDGMVSMHDFELWLEEQPRVGEWIPCSERLPKCNGCYLVWRPHFFGGEASMPAICYFDGQDTWHDSYGVDFTRILNKKDVIAWMPLPEPYKEIKKVEEGEDHKMDAAEYVLTGGRNE